jgi:hypothetical protein
MKATALIAAAALVCGTAAFAQQDHRAARMDNDNSARVEHNDRDSAGNKLSNGLHRLGAKTRNAFHRMGEKLHARNEHSNDTRAMGASGDNDHGRQSRMDEAYSHYRDRQANAEQHNR